MNKYLVMMLISTIISMVAFLVIVIRRELDTINYLALFVNISCNTLNAILGEKCQKKKRKRKLL